MGGSGAASVAVFQIWGHLSIVLEFNRDRNNNHALCLVWSAGLADCGLKRQRQGCEGVW